MRHKVERRWERVRATNSNGEDVAPTLCTTICKGTQRQLDNSGSYVLEYRREKKNKIS